MYCSKIYLTVVFLIKPYRGETSGEGENNCDITHNTARCSNISQMQDVDSLKHVEVSKQ